MILRLWYHQVILYQVHVVIQVSKVSLVTLDLLVVLVHRVIQEYLVLLVHLVPPLIYQCIIINSRCLKLPVIKDHLHQWNLFNICKRKLGLLVLEVQRGR